jgi:hypothetical protein
MAINLSHLQDGYLEVVASCDTALDMNEKEYEEYQKTLDKGLLKIKPGDEPTIFLLRKVLPNRAEESIKSKAMQYNKDDGSIYIGTSHISAEVRWALVDIKNPAHCPNGLVFKKDGDGGAQPQLMSLLDAAGITNDLYVARRNYLAKYSGSENLKKS